MNSPKYASYHRWYSTLLSTLFLGIIVSIALYGERFRFWEFPYSGLGATKTVNGYANPKAMLVFATDMICIGIILLIISIVSGSDRALPYRRLRTIFAASGGFGAFVATFPHDIYPTQHILGSAFLVGSLWVLAVFLIIDISRSISSTIALRFHFLLHMTVVSYAIAYVANVLSKQIFQKIAVFGLSVVLLGTSRLLWKFADQSADTVGGELEAIDSIDSAPV